MKTNGRYKGGDYFMSGNNLKMEILDLISSRQEGSYWDFKQEHHKNTANLLHDIICMANNPLCNQDGYIIYGVSDKTWQIIGIENDSSRRNQEHIISQLKSKSFAAGIRPIVRLITLHINEHEIDVLVIKNTMDTPYYLTSDFRDKQRVVRANHIYTRVSDVNTDIDKSADKHIVEALWKKHFGLNLNPFDRLKLLLADKSNWETSEDQHYNKICPEFTLCLEDDDDNGLYPEFYAYNMTNSNVHYGMLYAKYYNTTLYSRQTVTLDGGRYITVVPNWDFIHYDEHHHNFDGFKYFIKDDISYIFNQYLLEDNGDAEYAYRCFNEVILLFNSINEEKCFVKYIEDNLELLEREIELDKHKYTYIEPQNPNAQKKIVRELKLGKALKSIYERWNS
jgi:hypothetical protein